jgi:hypothetical protein
MPQNANPTKRRELSSGPAAKNGRRKVESRHTVGLSPSLASKVQRYAETADTSMSKAIATLVRLGLEGQESRKREFFKKLKENLADDDSAEQDRLVDEFRALVLGH